MKLQPAQQAQALTLKNRVDKLSADILAQDGQARDLDARPDAVTLSQQGEPLIFPASPPYKEQVCSAVVDRQNSKIETIQYYDSSYGRSAESLFEIEKTVQDGQTIYKERYYDPMGVRNYKQEARFNAAGELESMKRKEFAATWGEALKDVFTTPAGLILVGVAGALGGAPGTLGYALAGSAWPGLVTAGATAVGLAYYKTRAW